MEGINMAAFLLGYLGVVAFGIVALVALGLLLFGKTRAARLVFASGWLIAALLVCMAVLWLLLPDMRRGSITALELLIPLALLVSAVGQFIASLRSARIYAAALACAVASLLVLVPLSQADAMPFNLGEARQRLEPLFAALSMLLALASIGVAALLSRHQPAG